MATSARKLRPEAFAEYVGEQLAALSTHAADAIADGNPKAVHKARVATRRLKAALSLVAPAIDGDAVDPVAKLAKKVRKRLGAVRDSQVMADAFKAEHFSAADVKPLVAMLADRERSLRFKAARKLSAPTVRRVAKFGGRLRRTIEAASPTVEALLARAIVGQLDAFARAAAETGKDRDAHRVRVSGKQLRYTLEIAAAVGFAISAAQLKTFERFQSALGAWHDAAVLAAFVAASIDADRLAEHDTAAAIARLVLATRIARRAATSLRRFDALWQQQGRALTSAITLAIAPPG